MRHQIWFVTAEGEAPVGRPHDLKSEALEAANDLNSKPVDGGLYVVKVVPPTDDLRQAALKLLALLDDENATKGIASVPLSLMASTALTGMGALITRLECDRRFNSPGFASLTDNSETDTRDSRDPALLPGGGLI